VQCVWLQKGCGMKLYVVTFLVLFMIYSAIVTAAVLLFRLVQ
jgi:hypothetical protein